MRLMMTRTAPDLNLPLKLNTQKSSQNTNRLELLRFIAVFVVMMLQQSVNLNYIELMKLLFSKLIENPAFQIGSDPT